MTRNATAQQHRPTKRNSASRRVVRFRGSDVSCGATGERGVPAKILAEGGGAQYAETGGQPLDPLTTVTYDGEVNPVPGAVIAYVIEQDGGVDLDDGAKFTISSAANATAISDNGKVLITTADNNGRAAARPTMGSAPGTVRVSTYAMPANTPVTTAWVEGLANGTALNTTAGLVGLATFQIAVLQQSDGPTQFTGKILDHTGKPLQGVRVTISRTPLSVTTDASGDFTFLQDVPQGKLDLFVDGRGVTGSTPLPIVGGNTATSTPTQYPSLHFEVLAIRGQKNILPHPIYLPPLLMSQAKIVGGGEDVSLTIPGRDGFEMIVKANSVTFPDGTRIGPLVVSPVADDRLPMSPPGGGSSFMAGAAATIQPSGTRFDPPIEVRLPNTANYAPGERVVIYHWDHDIGQYVAMGQATVTDDGAQLITDPGSGITKAGWHGPPTPPPCVDTGVKGPCPDCQLAESIGGVGGNCPSIKICIKNTASTATCDDKDKCTVKDQCTNGICKGISPNVRIVQAPRTACVGRPVTFAGESAAGADRIDWWGAGFPGSGSTYSFTPDAEGYLVINASDKETPTSCGTASVTVKVITKRLDYTADGLRETDWCLANVSDPSKASACAYAAGMANYVVGTPLPGLPFTANPSGSWVGRFFSRACRTTEGSPADAGPHLLWSCLLNKSPISKAYADDILTRHENGRGDDSCESHEQDFNNNEIGRKMAEAGLDCEGEALRLAYGLTPSVPSVGRPQINAPMECTP